MTPTPESRRATIWRLVLHSLGVLAIGAVGLAFGPTDLGVALAFGVGGVQFVSYAPRLMSAALRRTPRLGAVWAGRLWLFGLGLVVWGTPLLLFFDGVGGVLHALVCAGVFACFPPGPLRMLAWIPLPGVIASWGIVAGADASWPGSGMSTSDAALVFVSVFNLILCPMFVLAAHNHAVEHPPRCEACGYELTGLSTDRCPECGEWFPPKQHRAAGPGG